MIVDDTALIIGLVVILIVGLILVRIVFRLTAALFRFGCLIICLIAIGAIIVRLLA